MTEAENTPRPDTIPLESLRRLDLRPGDKLAVIAPDWVNNEQQLRRFSEVVCRDLAEYHGVLALVFPPGAKVEIVSAEQFDVGITDPHVVSDGTPGGRIVAADIEPGIVDRAPR